MAIYTVIGSNLLPIFCVGGAAVLIAWTMIENRILTARTHEFLVANFAALSDVSGEITSASLLAASENPALKSQGTLIAFAWNNMHKFGHPTGATEWVAESNQLGDFRRERNAHAVGIGDLRLAA